MNEGCPCMINNIYSLISLIFLTAFAMYGFLMIIYQINKKDKK